MDEDNSPTLLQPQLNPSRTIGTQSTRTPVSHAMKQPYITLASVPFKTFDATRADSTLILSKFIPTSGIFRPPNEKVLEAYHAPQSTPTTGLTPSGSYSCTSQCPSKGSASLDFSETVQRLYGGKNLDPVAKSDQNLQPKSSMQNYRLTPRNQQCTEILGNGQVAPKETDLENCNVVDENKKCAWKANPTNLLNQNLGTCTNASGSNPELQKLEEPQDHEELRNRVDNLRGEVSELRKELLRISKESEEVEKENESLVEELVEKYGEESVADLIRKNPASP
ncbi:unnamed protein product [Lupinus luteus]|uniref:Uncharacterized protein n=1 Tax=Lupinus luteus TaxID=3873 RepID=A0AAV1Y5L5_LUPLU